MGISYKMGLNKHCTFNVISASETFLFSGYLTAIELGHTRHQLDAFTTGIFCARIMVKYGAIKQRTT